MEVACSTCHIGIAFYTCSNTQQRSIVLSDNHLFVGKVWCATPIETVNGWGAAWIKSDCSPASAFGSTAQFSGVVYVGQASAPINKIISVISRSNYSSELDRFPMPRGGASDWPWGSDKFVMMALCRLGAHEQRFVHLPEPDPASFKSRIERCLSTL